MFEGGIASNVVNPSNQFDDRFLELIEAYALGSLDPEELAAVAAHLATGCDECNQALAESRCLVSQLAYLAPESAPSAMLRRRVMQTVRTELAAAKVQASSVLAGTKSAISLWMWAAVAAALLFAFYNAYQANSLQTRIHKMQELLSAQIKLQHESARQLALAEREALILTNPESLKITRAADNKHFPALQAAWHQELGIVVSGQGLPAVARKRTLQLWLIPKTPGAKPLPSLTLQPDAEGKVDLLVGAPPDSQGATKALAITEEPEGGSPQPTSKPIWVGTIARK